ncbi:radical SAM protein [Chitinibacter bivalviorum]|uniref:Radical SAM protein n=1 Tax=Chitinibacter bivalviorum TaxID=2739434 RepID=A0A7H9BG68_9NEIS|nr:radical SAM protein [Chitinibacter bivalviorum]QLG87422.1 radical SAM protein [Chitinibacter bivalviorum]
MTIKVAAPLSVVDHRRDIAGLKYVYPVVSRRAGGVSIGINLNPNNACNWRCVYCQVPDLVRGSGPTIDLALLASELDQMLNQIVTGDFMQTAVPVEARRLNDIAFSGNGEPTTSPQFLEAIELVAAAQQRFDLALKTVLITNGSQLDKAFVQEGLRRLAQIRGEVWFKLDRAPVDGFEFVNQIALKRAQVERRLAMSAQCCPTWIQTCMFATDGQLPSEAELVAYVDFLAEQMAAGVNLAGVLLYGLARPSLQTEANRLSAAPTDWMQALAERIRAIGLEVKLST